MLIATQPSYDELLSCRGHALHSWFPPPHFERALHSVNQVFHHSGAKMDVLHSLIDYRASPETQRLNVAGS